ncbi:MAG: polymer-forming cytoskeletal protein [Balneolaceae bacterium]|nr:MAG: polymer-forming cytoskeletal protein [Balneolaceae bacterium]
MFNKNTKKSTDMTTPNQPMINMISEGTRIKGELASKSDVRIAGTVDGEIHAEGKCIVTNSGSVKGNISSDEADISGSVNGEIKVATRLILRKSARVNGNIHAKSFLVEEGAIFEGTCRMSEKPLENRQIEGASNGSGTKNKMTETPAK